VTKRTEIKKVNPDLKTTEISRILGQMWNDASEKEKRPFIQREEIEREEYKEKMNAWKRQKEMHDQENSFKSPDPNDSGDDWSISDSEDRKDQSSHTNDHEKLMGNNTLPFSNDCGDPAPTMERITRYQQPQQVLSAQPAPQNTPNPAPTRVMSESWNTSSLNSPFYPTKHHPVTYQQHSPHHSLALPHMEDVRSMQMMDERLSPIPVFCDEQDPPAFFTRYQGTNPSIGGMRHNAHYGWRPVPQPTYSYHQYKYFNPDAITSLGYNNNHHNPNPEPFQMRRNHIFQHDRELGCSPFGSYDELDAPIDPLPIR